MTKSGDNYERYHMCCEKYMQIMASSFHKIRVMLSGLGAAPFIVLSIATRASNGRIPNGLSLVRGPRRGSETEKITLLKLKSIFHTLNMFSVDVTQKCLIAECWVPTVDLPSVGMALHRGAELSGSTVHAVLNEMETHRMPPTYFKLNKFTQGFQNIVDAYGIASYREVNPAPWSIISFPFLFAVMFGDSGHGIIMLLAALSLVVFEKKLISMKIRDEIFNTFFGGRYVVLLMGIFSIYTGLLYNDIYSKSIDIFGSSWKNPYPRPLLEQMEREGHDHGQTLDLTLPPKYSVDSELGPYPFGVDPIWNIAKNKLNF
ncbi:putative V-type proton ATPase [Parelaphostrongylus tenuis]|uniref:V-type proton ATPase subunit a n=1 Tax=Parelaphostrongylus tenuis TaxID=148309 RepID=A0AAD5RCI7_PARTN|nr:putative V-type proton ATPase [Parelaphostrongylus tenuis]